MYVDNRAEFDRLFKLIKPISTWSWAPTSGSDMHIAYIDSADLRRDLAHEYMANICDLSGDNHYFFIMAHPIELIEKFYDECKVFPLIRFDAHCTEDEYYSDLDLYFRGNVRDWNLYYSADCFVVFPESLNWHIFAEESAELARFAARFPIPKEGKVPWFMPNDVINERMNWRKEPVY